MPLFTSNLRTAGVWCIEFNASLRRKSIDVCERENIHAYIFIPIYKQQQKLCKIERGVSRLPLKKKNTGSRFGTGRVSGIDREGFVKD